MLNFVFILIIILCMRFGGNLRDDVFAAYINSNISATQKDARIVDVSVNENCGGVNFHKLSVGGLRDKCPTSIDQCI